MITVPESTYSCGGLCTPCRYPNTYIRNNNSLTAALEWLSNILSSCDHWRGFLKTTGKECFDMVVLVFFISHWYLSLFAQTFFHHRYASHGAFTMSRFWERVFFIFSFIMQGSTYMSPKTYGIMHRLHHAHTDTIKDPHSPAFSSNIFSMMLRTSKIYLRIMDGLWKVDERYTKNLPEWKWMDDLGNAKWTRIAWGLAYITFYAFFATSAWMYLLLPVHILMGAFHGAIINWFAHKYGYRNFRLKNLSKNLFTIDVLMLGESYHNNHHKRPSSVNFGVRWHEIDPVYPVIWLLDRLRVIRIVKQPAMAAS